MALRLLGWPADGPTLRLDYRRFAYAGKFVMSNTGKAVVRDGSDPVTAPDDGDGGGDGGDDYDDDVVAAASFNEDRTDAGTLWIRYVTVREDRTGEGLGARLCAFVVAKAAEAGYDSVRIAVNNPFAYEALHKAGFGWTGETTGLAELVLERPAATPATVDAETYRRGLDEYRERAVSDAERRFLDARVGADPPSLLDPGDVRVARGDDGDDGDDAGR
jgi:GNAT superfamily N-acetyltransferase